MANIPLKSDPYHTEDQSLHGFIPQKIHILCDKVQELCSENVFLQEIDKMQSVMSAKRDFNERNDVVFYMTSDDLFKIQSSKSPVYIRLKPEQPSSKITTPYIESIKHTPESLLVDSSPRSNYLTKDRGDRKSLSSTDDRHSLSPHSARRSLSPRNKHRSSSPGGRVFSESLPSISSTINCRKNSKRSNSANSDKYINVPSRDAVEMKVIREKCLNISQKHVKINDKLRLISYNLDDTLYSIFILEQEGDDIICKGLEDKNTSGFGVYNLKGISVKYPIKSAGKEDVIIDASIYASDILNIKLPIYSIITTIDHVYSVKEFIGILGDLLELAINLFTKNNS